MNDITYGDITDFRNFMGAVIDPASYATITQAIEQSRHDSDADVVCGGQYDDAEGYFIAAYD